MYKENSIWKVDIDDEFLTFTQVYKPEDFEELAVLRPYDKSGLDGVYCGNRSYDDVQFKLVRRLKASDFYSGYCGSDTKYKDKWGNFSLMVWRKAFGYAYAWEPQGFIDYKGEIYTKAINFL